jgi:hypothetical protein
MRFNRPIILALILTLPACAQGTGVLPFGPDTYTVSEHRAPILGGGSEAQRAAITEATDYCENHGKKLLPLNSTQSGLAVNQAAYGNTSFSMTFRCLDPDDPELRRPKFQPATNTGTVTNQADQ